MGQKKSKGKNHVAKTTSERPIFGVTRELANLVAGYFEDIDWAQHEFEAGMTTLSRELVKAASAKFIKDVTELVPHHQKVETVNGVELGRIVTKIDFKSEGCSIELERKARSLKFPEGKEP
jgi:hypothetical protein